MSLPRVQDLTITPFVRGDMKLSDNEKKVYNTLLKLTGAVKVSRIAEWAGLPRTTTEYILKKFVSAKIAHTRLYGKRHVYYLNRTTNHVSGVASRREPLK
jgi:predicted transcriptional regulator